MSTITFSFDNKLRPVTENFIQGLWNKDYIRSGRTINGTAKLVQCSKEAEDKCKILEECEYITNLKIIP